MSAPSTELPGNIFYGLLFFSFASFFLYSAAVRFQWFLRAQRVNRFSNPLKRTIGLVPWLLGNARVARPYYWYSGLLHTLIWWAFLVLQIRPLTFLLTGVDHDASLEKLLGPVFDFGLRPTMDAFNLLVIVGVAMAAFQRFVWRRQGLTLNYDAWVILGLIFWLMVTDVFTNSAEIALHRGDHDWASFVAFGLAELWDEIGLTGQGLELFPVGGSDS